MLPQPQEVGVLSTHVPQDTTAVAEAQLLTNAVVMHGFAVGLPEDWIIYYPQRMLSGADRSGLVEIHFSSPDARTVGAFEITRMSPIQTGIGVERLFQDMVRLAERRGESSAASRYSIGDTEYYLVSEDDASGGRSIAVLMVPPHSGEQASRPSHEPTRELARSTEYYAAFLQLQTGPDNAERLSALLPSLMRSLRYLGPEWDGRYRPNAPAFSALESGLQWIGDLPGGMVLHTHSGGPNSFSLSFFEAGEAVESADINTSFHADTEQWIELKETDIELGTGVSEFFFGTDPVRMSYRGVFRPGNERVRALLIYGSFQRRGARYRFLLREMWGDRAPPSPESWHAALEACGYQTLFSYHLEPEGALLP